MSEAKKTAPKYACPNCGGDEVHSDLNAHDVFRAEGDKIVYLRSNSLDGLVMQLFCVRCGEEVPLDDKSDLKIN